MAKLVVLYFIVLNILAYMLFGVDKYKAVRAHWRIPEATLLLFAVLGGSVGALVGMRLFLHKTQKNKFRIGVPVILLVQAALACWLCLSAPPAFLAVSFVAA
ncbi:MAG: DUF1294 domain-containing protein [Oscillospiraceae bacterium]|nr:DUF1294 domain-containing protein [Oscillospiraceae bacterium]